MREFIDIVFSGEGPHLEFVEVEYPPNTSINAGEWVGRDENGFSRLRLRPSAFESGPGELAKEAFRNVDWQGIRAATIPGAKIEDLTHWSVKVPKWTRTDDLSECVVGPWTVKVLAVVEEGDTCWNIKIKGPFVELVREFWEQPDSTERAYVEVEAIHRLSKLADVLEPLQRYL